MERTNPFNQPNAIGRRNVEVVYSDAVGTGLPEPLQPMPPGPRPEEPIPPDPFPPDPPRPVPEPPLPIPVQCPRGPIVETRKSSRDRESGSTDQVQYGLLL
jgi:hypothetical protein